MSCHGDEVEICDGEGTKQNLMSYGDSVGKGGVMDVVKLILH